MKMFLILIILCSPLSALNYEYESALREVAKKRRLFSFDLRYYMFQHAASWLRVARFHLEDDLTDEDLKYLYKIAFLASFIVQEEEQPPFLKNSSS